MKNRTERRRSVEQNGEEEECRTERRGGGVKNRTERRRSEEQNGEEEEEEEE